jgi:succinoglycan biosynthesis protein ExoA
VWGCSGAASPHVYMVFSAPMHEPLLATVVIPMRNEEAFIVPCLQSLLANDVPGTIEFLVYDGESTDRSCALVTQLGQLDERISLHNNPKRIQAAAFNDAIVRARGRYFLRADAHSLYPPHYIETCIRLLEQTGADNVGGVVLAAGTDMFSSAVAAAVSSKFAVGDAQYRVATEPGWVDTIFPGAWRIETLRDLGGMREDWAVNEDAEMNMRLRQGGGRIYLTPELRPQYFVRSSVRGLIRQYARYGLWRARTLLAHPASLRWRQVVAPLFVISIVAAWPLTRWLGVAGAAHLILYALMNLVASAITAARSSWRYLPMLPLIFLIVHVGWGVGFIAGLCYWPFKNRGTA